jgi:hypothetical protein
MSGIGFTGTQRGLTVRQHLSLVEVLLGLREQQEWMHNGDSIGADAEAARLWRNFDGKIWLHPPIETSKRAYIKADIEQRPYTYLTRNHHIVECAEGLIGCPKEPFEVLRSGTWATIRYARTLQRRLIIIYPDGTFA